MTDAPSEFGEIYARHAAAVYRFALQLSRDRTDAEDITSETFVRALASRARIRTETVRAYLFTIARHYYLEVQRRRKRDVPLVDAIADPAPAPSARIEHSSDLATVSLALQRRPELDRAVLVMRAVDRMTYEEIARALGISVGAARVKAHRARLALNDIR